MKITNKEELFKRVFRIGSLLLVVNYLTVSCGTDARKYKNASLPIEERVDDLLGRMTLKEKIAQLNQETLGYNNNANNIGDDLNNISLEEFGSLIYYGDTPSLRDSIQKMAVEKTRLGIPVLFGYDVIHGFRTNYPIPLAQACSWNPELTRAASEMAAMEAKAAGVNWTFSPMIDVARDARWGRVVEGYGEDPYTAGVFGAAAVKGYQGDTLSGTNSIAACLKHFVGYGLSEGGRDYSTTNISNQALWDTYFIPYQIAIKAGAATVMSAFNDINGIPASCNTYTLNEVLKGKWQFDGVVVSDWASIEHLTTQGVATDRKDAALKGFLGGVDMNMKDRCYLDHLADWVEEGKIPIETIDNAVKRVLRLKFKLGLFEKPYSIEPSSSIEARRMIAEKAVEETIVLLKNKNNILPLQNAKRIAVVGPIAKDKENIIGSWYAHGKSSDVESVFEGLEKEFKQQVALLYAQGCDFEGTDTSGFQEAFHTASKADAVLVCLGEKVGWTGENSSRSTLSLPSIQEQLLKRISEAGKPIILLLSNGRPIELYRMEPYCDAIVEMWQPGVAGGTPVAGILSGRINPSGKLAITFPYSAGQIPIYYNERRKCRTHQGGYHDIPSSPMYEFTHGLSYTTFEYGEMKVSKSVFEEKDKVTVEVPVRNTGKREGLETVHWFISVPVSPISRPVKELRYFEKQLIKPGETKIFKFEINPMENLSFVTPEGKRFIEPGAFFIIVKNQQVKLELN